MEWLIVAVPAAVVALIITRLVQPRRLDSGAHLPPEISVTLSVLSTRTAVVVVDAGVDPPSAAVASLVEHAVRDAFAIGAVDVVEVRGGNGELLEQRRRGVLSV